MRNDFSEQDEAIDIDLSKINYDIYIKDGFIVERVHSEKNDGSFKEHVIADAVYLDEILDNIDTGEIIFKLRAVVHGIEKTFDIPRQDIFIRRKIIELSKYGIDIYEKNPIKIMEHIRNEEAITTNVFNVHSKLGWAIHDKKYIFKAFDSIGKIKSNYVGDLKIEPTGSLEKWLIMVNTYVIGNYALELALCIGFSSALVGLIGEDISIESLFVHIYNNSSKGKTTAAQLAESPWGYPSEKKPSLFLNWNATKNALLGSLVGNNGMLVVLDESSMSDSDDYTSTIFTLSGGKEKVRMNKEAIVKEPGQWVTTIFSTGEFSLLAKSKKTSGLLVRLIELANITWTPDARTADAIKSIVKKNYGHAGVDFVKKLFKLGKKELIGRVKKWQDIIDSKLTDINKDDEYSNRISTKMAILVVAGEVVSETFNIKLSLDKILEILINNWTKSNQEKDLGKRAYDHFMQEFNKNYRKFGRKVKLLMVDHSLYQEIHQVEWGIIERNKFFEDTKVHILCDIFQEIMKKGGFQDTDLILKLWSEKGILWRQEDRYYRIRKINSTNGVKVYSIRILEEKLDDPEDEAERLENRKHILELEKPVKRLKIEDTLEDTLDDL